MVDFIAETNLISSEDILVGLYPKQQKRNGRLVEVSAVNASSLLGILVVNSKEDLLAIDINLLDTKVVYVIKDSAIYKYDGTEWITETSNIAIIESADDLQHIPNGYKIAYNSSEALLYHKTLGEPWKAVGTYLYVKQEAEDFDNIPDGINMAIVVESGALYHRTISGWTQVVLDSEGDPLIIVETIEDLPSNPTLRTAIVNDDDRGGIFKFDVALVDLDDGGINIKGWIRQFSGQVSVLWYGAKGDDTTDNSDAFQRAFRNNAVIIPYGVYKIKNTVQCRNTIYIESSNALIKMEANGSFMFSGEAGKAIDIDMPVIVGSSQLQVDNRGLGEGKYIQLIDKQQSFGKHGRNSSQITRVLRKQTQLVTNLYNTLLHTFMQPSIIPLDTIKVSIDGLRITSSTSVSTISLNYVDNTTLTNCNIEAKNSTGVLVSKSINVKLQDVNIQATGSGQCFGVRVIDTDNFVVDAGTIYGTKNALKFERDTGICNFIGIYRSVIMASEQSIQTDGNTSGFNIKDSQITGEIQAGGNSFKVDNSIITSPKACVTLQYMVGGQVSFNNVSFIGTAAQVSYLFITNCAGNRLLNGFEKLAKPVDYTLRDCSFIDLAGKYIGIIDAISIPATTATPAIKSNLYAENIKYEGNTTVLKSNALFNFWGPFNNVTLKNAYINTTTGVFTQSDARYIYNSNKNTIDSMGFTTKYFNAESFYSDAIILTLASVELPEARNSDVKLKVTNAAKLIKDADVQGEKLEVVYRGESIERVKNRITQVTTTIEDRGIKVYRISYTQQDGTISTGAVPDLKAQLARSIRIYDDRVD